MAFLGAGWAAGWEGACAGTTTDSRMVSPVQRAAACPAARVSPLVRASVACTVAPGAPATITLARAARPEPRMVHSAPIVFSLIPPRRRRR